MFLAPRPAVPELVTSIVFKSSSSSSCFFSLAPCAYIIFKGSLEARPFCRVLSPRGRRLSVSYRAEAPLFPPRKLPRINYDRSISAGSLSLSSARSRGHRTNVENVCTSQPRRPVQSAPSEVQYIDFFSLLLTFVVASFFLVVFPQLTHRRPAAFPWPCVFDKDDEKRM